MRLSRVSAIILTGLSLSGCGLSVWDAANQYGSAYCKKLNGCSTLADSFAQTYPGGLAQCEQQWTNGDSSVDLGKSAGCSGAQLNTCLDDIKALTCSYSVDDTPLPASCAACYGPSTTPS